MHAPLARSWSLGRILALFFLSAPAIVSQTCTPVPAGLVSWWTFGGSGMDNQGYNPAALFGAQFDLGEVRHSLLLDGVDDFGRVGASQSLNVGVGGGFTIDMWINPADISAQHPLVEWNTGTGFQTHFWYSVTPPNHGNGPGSLFTNILSPNGTWHILSSAPSLVLPNVWQHVAVTYDKASGASNLYLNGAVVAQGNLGSFTPLTTGDLYFGFRPSDGEIFSGQLDEIDLFNRALSGPEINSIFGAGAEGKCSSLLLPTSLDFGSQPVGTASGAQTVTLTNQKTTKLRVLSIGTSGAFGEQHNCGPALQPGAACSITVTFAPMTTGTQNGLLIVLDDASATPHKAVLIGTGI